MDTFTLRPDLRLRPYRLGDEAAVQRAADDIRVARYMLARFPHPYTADDAQSWVKRAAAEDPVESFVIELDGDLIGTVGLSALGQGHDGVALVGYWLTPQHWGKGVATDAVGAIVELAVARGFRRLFSNVYAPNVGSARVLRKNGFVLEGRLREHRVGRDGEIMDELLFGRLLTSASTCGDGQAEAT